MFRIAKDWNPKQSKLKEIISRMEHFDDAMQLCLELHSIVHSAQVSGQSQPTFYDELWAGLSDKAFATMPTAKDVTIAWNLWHITRIEDLTTNILMQNSPQVLDSGWMEKLGATATDTGNAMTGEEISLFSAQLNPDILQKYRDTVGHRTRDILSGLVPQDLKRKIGPERITRILSEGGVTKHPDSIWLLDFWGKKTVAGILLMPITRHQIVHVNDSMKLKKKMRG